MRTIQEYFKEANIDELVGTYLYNHPVNLHELPDKDISITEAKERIKEKLRDFINRLQTMEAESPEDGITRIFFAHKIDDDWTGPTAYSLVDLNELLENGEDAQVYGHLFTKQAQVMGYLVADTKYTQNHIYGLMADVMHESSFFGFEQERLDEEIESMEKSAKEAKEGKCKTFSLDDLYEEFGFERPEKDEESDELKKRITLAQADFNLYHKKKELRNLLELCLKE